MLAEGSPEGERHVAIVTELQKATGSTPQQEGMAAGRHAAGIFPGVSHSSGVLHLANELLSPIPKDCHSLGENPKSYSDLLQAEYLNLVFLPIQQYW